MSTTNTYPWTDLNDPLNTAITSPVYTIANGATTTIDWGNLGTVAISSDLKGDTLTCNGSATFEGDVKIKGKSISDSLEKIEEKLAILHPNEELEEKWEQLRDLRKMYMELEQEIKDKEKVWGILKK